MKRVLFISPQPFFQWRGSPIRVGFDLRALAELGYEVDLLTLPVGEEIEMPGVRIIRVRSLFGVKNVPIGPSFVKLCFDLLLLCRACSLARKNRYDIIHCVEDAGPIGVCVAWLFRGKLVFEKHSDPSSYRKGPLRNLIMGMYSRVERFTIRHADAIIGTGAGLADQIREMAPDKSVYHIFDIPSSLTGSDSQKTKDIRHKLLGDRDAVLIAYVGSFAVYQGVDLMFEAIPEVVRRCAQARFMIIGGTAEEVSARRESLAEKKADHAVHFVGRIPPDELPNYLSASDILLSPRLAGVNTPLKLLDYFKAGRAIVATDTESNRLLLNAETAELTDVTPSAFASGIVKLISDKDGRDRLSAKGREMIDCRYNFPEFKKKLGVCYSALVPAEGERPQG